METYNFWSDLLDTFQSSTPIVQIVWLLIPPGFVLGLVALVLHYRQQPNLKDCKRIYTMHRDHPHTEEIINKPTLVLLKNDRPRQQENEEL